MSAWSRAPPPANSCASAPTAPTRPPRSSPGAPTLDIVALLAASADRPLISYFTSDEHAFLVAGSEGVTDPTVAERELVAAARRAGAALVITYGAFALASS